jgi:hypothetical protein
VPIDPIDRRTILLANNQAATFAKLCEVTVSLEAMRLYLTRLHAWTVDLDRAIEAAERRAA